MHVGGPLQQKCMSERVGWVEPGPTTPDNVDGLILAYCTADLASFYLLFQTGNGVFADLVAALCSYCGRLG